MSIKVDIQPDTSGVDSALRRLSNRLRGVNADVNSVSNKLNAGKLRIDTKSTKADLASVNKELIKLNTTVTSTTDSMRNAFVKLGAAVTAAFAVKGMITSLTRAGDAMTNYGNKIALVTGRGEEAIRVQNELMAIARRSNGQLSSSMETFSKFGASLSDNSKYSVDQLLRVTETVQKAVAISGSSAESASAAIIQLGQGLGSGTLRGEELNSVLEQTPRLAKAIAEGMGISLSQLRNAAANGQVTTDVVMDALIAQGEAIDQEFTQIEATVAQTATALKDSLLPVIAGIDKELGSSKAIKALMNQATDYLTENKEAIISNVAQIKAAVTSTFTQIAVVISSVIERIASFAKVNNEKFNLFSYLTESAKKIPAVYVSLLRTIGGLGKTDLSGVFNSSFESLISLFRDIRSLASNSLTYTSKLISSFAKEVDYWFFWIYDRVIGHSWWTDLMGDVESLADKHLTATLAKVKAFASSVNSTFKSAYTSNKDKVVSILPSWDDFKVDVDRYVGYLLSTLGKSLSVAWRGMFDISPVIGAVVSAAIATAIVRVFSKDLASKWVKLNWTAALLSGASYALSKMGEELLNSGMLNDMASALGKQVGNLGSLMVQNIPIFLEALQQLASGFVSSFLGQFGIVGEIVSSIVGTIDKVMPGSGLLSSILLGVGGAAFMGKLDTVMGYIRIFFGFSDKAKKEGDKGGIVASLLMGGSTPRTIIGYIAAVAAALNMLGVFFTEGGGFGSTATLGSIAGILIFGGDGGFKRLISLIDTVSFKLVTMLTGKQAKFSLADFLFGKDGSASSLGEVFSNVVGNLFGGEKANKSLKEQLAMADTLTNYGKKLAAMGQNDRALDFLTKGAQIAEEALSKTYAGNTSKDKGLLKGIGESFIKSSKELFGALDSITSQIESIFFAAFARIKAGALAVATWANRTLGSMGLLGRIMLGAGVAAAILALFASTANAGELYIEQKVSAWSSLYPLGVLGVMLLGPSLGRRLVPAIAKVISSLGITSLVSGLVARASSLIASAAVALGVSISAAFAAVFAGAVAAGGLLMVWLFGEGDSLWEKLVNLKNSIVSTFTGISTSTRKLRGEMNSLNSTKKVGNINTDLSKELASINLGALSDDQVSQLRKQLVKSNEIFSKNSEIFQSEGVLTRDKIDETNRILKENKDELARLSEANSPLNFIDNKVLPEFNDKEFVGALVSAIKPLSNTSENINKKVNALKSEAFALLETMRSATATEKERAEAILKLMKLRDNYGIDEEALSYGFDRGSNTATAWNRLVALEGILTATSVSGSNPLNTKQTETLFSSVEEAFKYFSFGIDKTTKELGQFQRFLWDLQNDDRNNPNRLPTYNPAFEPKPGDTREAFRKRLEATPQFTEYRDIVEGVWNMGQAALVNNKASIPVLNNMAKYLTAITEETIRTSTATAELLSKYNALKDMLPNLDLPEINPESGNDQTIVRNAMTSYSGNMDMLNVRFFKEQAANGKVVSDALLKSLNVTRDEITKKLSEGEIQAEYGDVVASWITGALKTDKYLAARAELEKRLEQDISQVGTSVAERLKNQKPLNVNFVNLDELSSNLLTDFSKVTNKFKGMELPNIDLNIATPEQYSSAWDQVRGIEALADSLAVTLSTPGYDPQLAKGQLDSYISAIAAFVKDFGIESDKVAYAASLWKGKDGYSLIDFNKIISGSPSGIIKTITDFANSFWVATTKIRMAANLGLPSSPADAKDRDTAEKNIQDTINLPSSGWISKDKNSGGGGDKRTWWEKLNENLSAMNLPIDSDALAGISAETLNRLITASDRYKAAQEAINKSAAGEVEKRQQSLALMKEMRLEAIDSLNDGTVEGQQRWLEGAESDIDTDFLSGLNEQMAGLAMQTAATIFSLKEQLKTMRANSVEAQGTVMAIEALSRSMEAAQSGAETMKSAFQEGIQSFLSGQATFKDVLEGLLDTFTQTVIQKFTESLTNTLWDALDLDSFFAKIFGGISKAGDSAGTGIADKIIDGIGGGGEAPLSDKEGGGKGFLGGMSNIFSGFSNTLSSLFSGLGGIFSSLLSGLGSMLGSIGSGIMGFFGFADGGQIRGPGTGRSDSILARVSNGEYIVNAAATRQWLPVLQAINSGKGPKLAFANGGLVGPVDTSVIPVSSNNKKSESQVFNINITGDIKDQTKKEIYRMLPEIATGVNTMNRNRGNS